MSAPKESTDNKEVTTAVADEIDDLSGTWKRIGGSRSDHWNDFLLNQTFQTVWLKPSDEQTSKRQLTATMAALAGTSPKDEIEGMIAAQLFAAHNAAMECYRRAMHHEQTFEGRRENLNQANKLSRTFATLLDSLNRNRGKGQQKVTVEHVHVHDGGRAVVGVVGTQGDSAKLEDQPHAKQIVYATERTMWGKDEEREPVPLTGDAEPPAVGGGDWALEQYDGTGTSWTKITEPLVNHAVTMGYGLFGLVYADQNTNSMLLYLGQPGQWQRIGHYRPWLAVTDDTVYAIPLDRSGVYRYDGAAWTRIRRGPVRYDFIVATD